MIYNAALLCRSDDTIIAMVYDRDLAILIQKMLTESIGDSVQLLDVLAPIDDGVVEKVARNMMLYG